MRLEGQAAAADKTRQERRCSEALRVLPSPNSTFTIAHTSPRGSLISAITTQHFHVHAGRHAYPSTWQGCPARTHVQWTEAATTQMMRAASPDVRHHQRFASNAIHQPARSRIAGREARGDNVQTTRYARRMVIPGIDSSTQLRPHLPSCLPLNGHP